MKIEHKIFEAEVKSFDDENLILEHFISTEHKDRGGDIMRAKGMRIIGKPVVLMLHGRGPMSSEPIGKPLSITVDEFKGEPGVLARTQLFPDEVGRRLYAKAKGGFLPNWSIGYSVDEAKDIIEAGKYSGRDVTKWQLFEYSPVGVPMNPFAQTVKEFLDKNEDPKGPFEVPESHWFGVVEEKTCTGCGACGEKHPCPTCKGDLTLFVKDGNNIGIACEKCEPEKFAELTKAIAPPESPPSEGPTLKDLCDSIQIVADNVSRMSLEFINAKDSIEELRKSVEPLLSTLPPEPEGGEEGKEGDDNPPEPKVLVFHDSRKEDQAKREAEEARKREVVEAVRGCLRPIIAQQADKVLGKVH